MQGYADFTRQCNKMKDPTKCHITKLITKSYDYKKRMENTIIENKDYREIIKKYDSEDTLYYIDPMYEDHAADYNLPEEAESNSPQVVAETVKNIKGKAIISINDSPNVRKAFSDPKFNIMEICIPYTTVRAGHDNYFKCKKELIITNFPTECKWIPDKRDIKCNGKLKEIEKFETSILKPIY